MKQFIVIFSLKVPLEVIGERLMNEHFAHLRRGYDLGYILLYGPRDPESGSVAIVRAESRLALGLALLSDPLLRAGTATYDFTEFVPVKFPSSLQGWVFPLEFHPPGIHEFED